MKPEKDQRFETFLERQNLSEGARDSARMAFYGRHYPRLYQPIYTGGIQPTARQMSPVHSREDMLAGLSAFNTYRDIESHPKIKS